MKDIKEFDFEEVERIVNNAPEGTDTYVGGELDYINMVGEGIVPRNLGDLKIIKELHDRLIEFSVIKYMDEEVIIDIINAETTSIHKSGLMGFPGKTEEMSATLFKRNLIKKLNKKRIVSKWII